MKFIKLHVENNFSLLMIFGLCLGLSTDVFGHVPDYVPPTILAIMMGFSYSKISLEELLHVKFKAIGFLYVWRYIIYPFALYGFFDMVMPDYKYAALLIGLLPLAVSCAPVCSLLGGNASVALAGTVVSSIVAPFLIPLAFEFYGFTVDLDTLGMFYTLAGMIFLPGVVYFGFIRFLNKPKAWVKHNASFAAVTLFSLFVVIVVSKLRHHILIDPLQLIEPALVMVGILGSFYAIGWFMPQASYKQQITNALFSGCINMGLGVTLAILFFTPDVQVAFILAEFIWIFFLAGFQYMLKGRRNDLRPA